MIYVQTRLAPKSHPYTFSKESGRPAQQIDSLEKLDCNLLPSTDCACGLRRATGDGPDRWSPLIRFRSFPLLRPKHVFPRKTEICNPNAYQSETPNKRYCGDNLRFRVIWRRRGLRAYEGRLGNRRKQKIPVDTEILVQDFEIQRR